MSFYWGPKIVTDGLILYIDPANSKCYPGSGTNLYDLIDSNNITLSNESIGTATTNLLQFDVVDYEYGVFNNLITINKNNGSFSVWVYSNGDYTSEYDNRGTILSHTSHGNMQLVFHDNSTSTNYRLEGETNDNGNYYCQTAFIYEKNTWYHIHINFDNSTSYTYVNNELADTKAITNDLSLSRIGGKSNSIIECRQLLNGFIGPISIYNRSLSDNEILQNYNAQKGRF